MAISDKLTYLNTTKTKIRKGLNSLGADLDTEDTFRSYADAIDEIYQDYPKITGEGESLSLDNTKQASMEIDYKGQTSQTSYSGKNLIDLATYSSKDSNVTLSFIDNNLLVSMSSGSYGKVIYDVTSLFKANQGKKINIRYDSINLTSYTGTSSNTLIQIKRNSTNTTLLNAELTKTIYTIPSDITDSDVFQIAIFGSGSSSNASSVTYNKLMFYFGEESASFEPYVGGIASPNPQYPQPINVVSGDNYIDICGKNLFNPTETWSSWYGTTCTITNQQITWSGTSTTGITRKIADINLPSGTYTISLKTISGSHTSSKHIWVDYMQGNTKIAADNFTQDGSKQRTLSDKVDNIKIGFDSADTFNNYTFVIQIEKGSTATTYEPYIGNSYPIYLGVENLLNRSLCTENRFLIWTSGLLQSDTGSLVSDYIKVDINQNYAFNYVAQVLFYDSSKTYIGALATDGTSINKDSSIGFSTIKVPNNNEVVYMRLGFRTSYNDNLDMTQQSIIVNKGSMPSHVSTNPIELCKIGTYQDYIYKDNGSWYLHKEIGKLILGNANYIYNSSNKRFFNTFSDINLFVPTDTSRHDEYIKAYCFTNSTTDADGTIFQYQNQLIMHNYNYTDTTDFKNWLISINAYLYYVLATPTNTPITDTTLINQLEESKLSYISQTNISQVNNDLPFNLDVKALRGE